MQLNLENKIIKKEEKKKAFDWVKFPLEEVQINWFSLKPFLQHYNRIELKFIGMYIVKREFLSLKINIYYAKGITNTTTTSTAATTTKRTLYFTLWCPWPIHWAFNVDSAADMLLLQYLFYTYFYYSLFTIHCYSST